jgi:tRNA1(Val) A37 N6-methylase TrmN6
MCSSRLNGRESTLTKPERTRGRNCGTYSTPEFIADTMAKELLTYLGRSSFSSPDIVDLSVEAGQFPLSLLIRGSTRHIRFYGMDRDPVPLAMAERLCRFGAEFSSSGKLRLSVTNQDSLLEDPPGGWPRRYSAVIGNPPWKGGHTKYNELVRGLFQPELRGNFDLYLAFILRAHELVRPGGFLSFVIPSTFLFNQNAGDVRRLLLKDYDILSLHVYPQGSFIEVPCLIPISFLARKRASVKSRSTTLISYHPTELGGAQRPRYSERVAVAAVWRQLPGHVFHPLIRKNCVFLLGIRGQRTLKEFGEVGCGARLSSLEAINPGLPFLGIHARHIRAFHACARAALKYGRGDAVFSRPPSAEVIAAPKVVFQDLRYMTHGTRLVAATAGAGMAPVSTASMFRPKDAQFLHFYAALLNSALVNAWYKVRDVNRSIKLFHIRELPIVYEKRAWDRIGAMALDCSTIWERSHEHPHDGLAAEERFVHGSPGGCSEWSHLRSQIDSEIFDLYDVSASQRNIVFRLVNARAF